MAKVYTIAMLLLAVMMGCDQSNGESYADLVHEPSELTLAEGASSFPRTKGALLTTRMSSYDALKKEIKLAYYVRSACESVNMDVKTHVQIVHKSHGKEVASVLAKGVSEKDIKEAQKGGLLGKIGLGINSPYTALNRSNLLRIFYLGRRRPDIFGEGDVAFFDLAETMYCDKMDGADLAKVPDEDHTEKGFINTFNHITAQALMTSIFSEKYADYIADLHERKHMPELITGRFGRAHEEDIYNGVVDNYVDIVNNEWGQELGKELAIKYKIDGFTHWTPDLLSRYLNDMLDYYSWSLQVGFVPYKTTDEVVVRFADKINRVNGNVLQLNQYVTKVAR